MKRRSFLQWILGVLGVGTVGVSKAKEAPQREIKYVKVTECRNEDFTEHWPIKENKSKRTIKWRRWARLEKEPEAYTRENIEAARVFNQETKHIINKFRAQKERIGSDLLREIEYSNK